MDTARVGAQLRCARNRLSLPQPGGNGLGIETNTTPNPEARQNPRLCGPINRSPIDGEQPRQLWRSQGTIKIVDLLREWSWSTHGRLL